VTEATQPFLRALAGEPVWPPPVWLMRQAGRYLAEYKATRSEAGSFLELCYKPDLAAEVTLQPIRRFGFDAAILFSDILVVPHALGQDLWFEEGEGPRLAPDLATAPVSSLMRATDRLNPIYETVRTLRAKLPATTPLIGFAGSPWTVATYMIEGKGSKDHGRARLMAYADREKFAEIIGAITAQTITYLSRQIEAGAQAVQLFDSWCGVLAPAQFEAWVLGPTRQIVSALKGAHPLVPIIGFPRGCGPKLSVYAQETGVDAVGIDETMDLAWAIAQVPRDMAVQGNLDPLTLIAGGRALEGAVAAILRAGKGRPFVFNLGHGIGQTTPVANVERLMQLVRAG
jgi:uroporphyrinogen decarboxylase